MKKNRLFRVFLLCLLVLHTVSFRTVAQSYEQMWEQVEVMEQKQLPKSAVGEVQKIYDRASREKNVPQLMKAWLTKASLHIDVTPDSLPGELDRLKKWAIEETDPVHQAVLNNLLGYYILDTGKRDEATIDSAISYFRLSLQNPEILATQPAGNYRPMTVSAKLSETYYNDNMFQLLASQAITRLKGYWIVDPALRTKIETEVLAIHDRLISYYKQQGMRDALLLSLLDKLYMEGYDVGRGGVGEKLRLTQERVVDLLKQWTVEFADSPVCGEVYNQLAVRYDAMGDYVAKLQAAQTGLEKYPQSPSCRDLKEQVAEVLTPRFNADIPFAYPGMDVDFKIHYRNLSGVTVELYRMDLTPTSSVLAGGEIYSSVVKKYGRLVDSRHYQLAETPDYKETDTLVHYRFPEEGIYVIKSIPDGNPAYTAYERAYVSTLQAVLLDLPDGKQEITVVDKLTGHPVVGTEVAYYRVDQGGGFRLIETHPTIHKGCVTLVPPKEENWLGINVRKPEADYMEITYAERSVHRYNGNTKSGEQKKISLFTDRTLYRPGQIVYVAGWVYGQQGDSTYVLPATESEVILRDANRQEIGKLNLTTDSLGTFSGNFVLPETVRPGEFELAVKDGDSHYIRVDEYKRSTFDVIFHPYRSSYQMGDTLLVTGEVKTFAGVPVGECELSYKTVRSQNEFWRISGNETILETGKLLTNADGSFELPVFLRKPDDFNTNDPGRYYTFNVTAQVINKVGEMESNSLSLPVGLQSLALRIRGLRSKVAREKRDSMEILATNLSGQLVKSQTVCVVYSLDEAGRKRDEVWRDTIETQRMFVPHEMLKLPAANYRMEVAATDEQGRLCSASQDFVLFSLSDRRLPIASPEWFYQDGTTFYGEQPVNLYVGTSEKDVCLFYDVFCGKKRIHSERMTLSDEIRPFSYVYKPEYGDGITVNFAFMRKGVFYSKQVKITRPCPKKELKLQWKTFRDKLLPGGKETWELRIMSPDKKAADACLLATLYDASLDKLYLNDWDFRLNYPRFTPDIRHNMIVHGHSIWMYSSFPYSASSAHGFSWNDFSYMRVPLWRVPYAGLSFREKVTSRMKKATDVEIADEISVDNGFDFGDGTSVIAIAESSSPLELDDGSPYVPLRENFAETAFFYPSLRTDTNGVVSIAFTLPETLTEWKFMGLAHTSTMDYGFITAKAKAVKSFMVETNMPRFIRVNDEAVISTTITNISEKTAQGIIRMELIVPETREVISTQKRTFNVDAHRTMAVSFDVKGDDKYSAYICRIVAETDGFSDGEQHLLPVLSDKQWMTDAISVQLNGTENKTVALDGLYNDDSKTAIRKQLTVELTANPEWYAVQALPVIAEADNDDALSWATVFYANSLSDAILNTNADNKTAVSRLRELQLPDGSWSWYKGMRGNDHVTYQIAEMFARLQAMNISVEPVKDMYDKALDYLADRWMTAYRQMIAEEKKGKKDLMPDGQSINYLYICALDKQAASKIEKKACSYMIDKLESGKSDYTIYEKARVALILYEADKQAKAKELVRSIKEYTVTTDEMGRYFDTSKATYSWNSYRIPTQVAAIEAISCIDYDSVMINEMKQWLLKQKQVQVWETSVATADAVYAFLSGSKKSISGNGRVKVKIAEKEVVTPNDTLGYASHTFFGKEAEVREIEISRSGAGMGWAAVYAQYMEDMGKVRKAKGNGLKITRTYSKNGKTVSPKTELHVGDELTVQLTVKADRDMDFIHITDSRAASMEPKEKLSGYVFSDNIGCYQVIKDSSIEFFIDKFRKGTVQLEYKIYLDRPGVYQTGITTVRSVYAPEFTGYSGSTVIDVQE